MNKNLLILWGILATLLVANTDAKLTLTDLKNYYNEYYYQPFRNLQESGVTLAQSEAKRDEVCDYLAEDVDVESGEVVSESDRKSWDNNKESMQKTRDANYLDPIIMDEDGDYGKIVNQIVKIAGVFAVFGVLSILGLFLYLSCCICEGCCPPCKLCISSCKQEKPYEGIAKYWSAVGVYITSIMLFVIGILGLVYVNGIEDSFHTFSCTGMITFHGASFGGGDFAGVNFLGDELTEYRDTHMADLLSTAQTQFDGNLPPWAVKEEDVMNRINSAMLSEDCTDSDATYPCQAGCQAYYDALAGEAPEDPFTLGNDPTTYATGEACQGQTWNAAANSYTYPKPSDGTTSTDDADKSKFFTDYLVDAQEKAIWTQAVETVKDNQDLIVVELKNMILELEQSGQEINNQSHTFEDGLNDAISAVNDFKQSSLDLMDDIATFHNDYRGIFGSITQSLTGFYAFFIALSIITAVITTLVFFLKIYKIRLVLHGVWCLQSLIMIFTFFTTVLFLVISLIGEQGCEIMHNALNDPVEYERYSKKIDKDIRNKITICKRELNLPTGPYQGEDDIATAFDVNDELDSVRDLRDSLIKITAENGDFSEEFDKLKLIPDEIDELVVQLEALRVDQGNYPETAEQNPVYDTDNVAVSIDTISQGNCQTDKLVGYDAECPSSNVDTFNAAAGGSLCYKLSDPALEAGYMTRYNACTDYRDYIGFLINWRNAKDDVVELKKLQTQALKKQLNYYIALNENYIEITKGINDDIVVGLNFIAHEETGILKRIRCFWFGEQLDNIYDSFCVKFVNSCYNFAFVLGWFSFSLFFGVFFIFMSVRRMGINQKYANQVQVQDTKAEGGYEPAKPQEEPGTGTGYA